MTRGSLHGRDAPLARLREALARAHAGRGQVIVLAGEAGIGKSALAEALAEEARAIRAAVTWGRAWEFAEAPPYFPLWPAMRSLDLEPQRGSELDDGGGFELWERVLTALARRAQDTTMVWLVEDVHAADLGTLDLLTFLAQPVRAMRVLIVATLRPHDPRLGDRKLQRLARIARDGLEVNLEPLAAPAIAAVAEEMLGRALPAPALERLVELTGGNALFVVECARTLRAGGVERVLDALPPTVRHLVLERVALLPAATRALLDAGAVLGREFSAATVSRVTGSQPGRVIDELVPALRAAVLREVRAGQFAFSHVVVRDAIEAAIAGDVRARLHVAAAEALAEQGEHAEILIERARHAIAAAPVGDPMSALALAHRAAEQLEREGAFDRAFELRAKVEEARAAGVLPPATALEKLHVARVARDAGRVDVMQRTCEHVLDAARAAADHELFAHAALLHATVVRPGVVDARQLAMLEEARVALPPGPTMCRVLARLSTALQPTDDTTLPNQYARRALRDARALGDDTLVLDVLDLATFGMWGTPRAERIAWSSELRDLALRADDVPRASSAWSALGLWAWEGGQLDQVALACAQALELAERAAHPRHRWDPLLLASGYACALGNFAESERYLAEVAQIAALIDDPALEAALVCHELGRAKLRRRADEAAVPLTRLEHAVRDFKRASLVAAAMRACFHARLGDVETTRAELSRIGTQARVFEGDVEVLALLAEAYALAGSDADRRWARDVLVRAEVVDVLSAGVGYLYETSVDRIVGLLDASLGDLAAAEASLRRAYSYATERGLRPWIAQLAHELAIVVARRGGDPRDLAAQADAVAAELGVRGFGPVAAPVEVAHPVRMRRTAEVWTIERGAALARVKDSRGMQLLARLVERPGEEIHVLALASDEGASAPETHAGEMLDERARRSYRTRIVELDESLAAAEQRGDTGAALRLEREKAALVRELARATGLGGRARLAGSGTERARVNVQRRVKEAIARITEANPQLGAFLETSIRTGTFCLFRP